MTLSRLYERARATACVRILRYNTSYYRARGSYDDRLVTVLVPIYDDDDDACVFFRAFRRYRTRMRLEILRALARDSAAAAAAAVCYRRVCITRTYDDAFCAVTPRPLTKRRRRRGFRPEKSSR